MTYNKGNKHVSFDLKNVITCSVSFKPLKNRLNLGINYLMTSHKTEPNNSITLGAPVTLTVSGQAVCYEELKSFQNFVPVTQSSWGLNVFLVLFQAQHSAIIFGKDKDFQSLLDKVSGSCITFLSKHEGGGSFWLVGCFVGFLFVCFPCRFMCANTSEEVFGFDGGGFAKKQHTSNQTAPSNFPPCLGAQEAKLYYAT